MEEKLEGFILQRFLHLNQSLIIKVYSPKGLFSFFVKEPKRKKQAQTAFFSPFCKAEVFYQKKSSSLYKATSVSITEWNLGLRSSIDSLQAAGAMAKALLLSEMPEKPAETLYHLFAAYLEKLPSFPKPEILEASFLLKLFLYQGTLHFSPCCFYCDQEAEGFTSGVSVCKKHAQPSGILFSKKDWNHTLILGKAKKFSHLKEAAVPKSLLSFLEKEKQKWR